MNADERDHVASSAFAVWIGDQLIHLNLAWISRVRPMLAELQGHWRAAVPQNSACVSSSCCGACNNKAPNHIGGGGVGASSMVAGGYGGKFRKINLTNERGAAGR